MIQWLKYFLVDLYWMLGGGHPNDVTIVSYPKCGVTWLLLMLSQLVEKASGLDMDKPTTNLRSVTEQVPGIPTVGWSHDCGDIISEAGARPDPHRIFLYTWRLGYWRRKVILLIRDPRDVAVSYFHQATKRSAKPMSFPSPGAFATDPLYGVARIVQFYRVWYHNRRLPKGLLVVRYEDLLTQGATELRRIADFLDLQKVDDALIEQVYDATRADKMRKMETKGAVAGMRNFGEGRDSLKVRKARAGGYVEELTTEEIEACNAELAKLPDMMQYGAERQP